MNFGASPAEPIRIFLRATAEDLAEIPHRLVEELSPAAPDTVRAVVLPRETALPATREGDLFVEFRHYRSTTPKGSPTEVTSAPSPGIIFLSWPVEFGEGATPAAPARHLWGAHPEASDNLGLLAAELLDRAALASPRTDLELAWSPAGGADKSALDALRERSGAGRALREQSARLIAQRRLRDAREPLERAMELEPTVALSAYWYARLLGAVAASTEACAEAITAARQAAEIARAEAPRGPTELASWWLLARLCAWQEDLSGLQFALRAIDLDESSPLREHALARRLLWRSGDRATFEARFIPGLNLKSFSSAELAAHCRETLDPTPRTRPSAPRPAAPRPAPRKRHFGLFGEELEALRRTGRELLAVSKELTCIEADRDRLESLQSTVPQSPKPRPMLEAVWPKLAITRAELVESLRLCTDEVDRLLHAEDRLHHELETRARAFADRVEAFEQRFAAEIGAGAEPIRHADEEFLLGATSDLGSPVDAVEAQLFPPSVAAQLPMPTLTAPTVALFRLTSGPDQTSVASRAGAYFPAEPPSRSSPPNR